MRYFKNVKEALFEVERDLVEMGIDVWPKSMQNKNVEKDIAYQTKELVGYGFRVNNAIGSEAISSVAEFYKTDILQVQEYCFAEIRDRLSDIPLNPGTSYRHRLDMWEPFLNKNGKFDYTYSERLHGLLDFLRDTLTSDPASRQAVLSIWRPLDLTSSGGKARIPCSLHYQFLIRPEGDRLVLHILYAMRSCDLYNHFGYDVALAILLAGALGRSLPYPIKAVHLTMNMGSLHAYRQDYEPRNVF
jgi:thymidylate synthase